MPINHPDVLRIAGLQGASGTGLHGCRKRLLKMDTVVLQGGVHEGAGVCVG